MLVREKLQSAFLLKWNTWMGLRKTREGLVLLKKVTEGSEPLVAGQIDHGPQL